MLFENKIRELMSNRKINFGLAFELLYEHNLLEELRSCNFSFEEWDCICISSSGNLKELALEKMVDLAKKEEDWLTIYGRSESIERIRELSLKKISNYIKNFEECIQIYILFNGPLKELALEKFVRFGETPDELLFLYTVTRQKELKEAIIKKLSTLAKTFDDWLEIYKRSSAESELKKVAIEKMKTMI